MRQDVLKTIDEASRLRVNFFHRELELIRTLLELTRTEMNIDDQSGALQALRLAKRGFKTIHRLIDWLPAPDRQQVALELARLEHQAAPLQSELHRRPKQAVPPGRRAGAIPLENSIPI